MAPGLACKSKTGGFETGYKTDLSGVDPSVDSLRTVGGCVVGTFSVALFRFYCLVSTFSFLLFSFLLFSFLLRLFVSSVSFRCTRRLFFFQIQRQLGQLPAYSPDRVFHFEFQTPTEGEILFHAGVSRVEKRRLLQRGETGGSCGCGGRWG